MVVVFVVVVVVVEYYFFFIYIIVEPGRIATPIFQCLLISKIHVEPSLW